MAIDYGQHNWAYGEEFTPDKLNNIEKGIKANTDAINEVNNNLTGLQFKVFTAQMPTSRSAFYLGAFAENPEKGYIVSAMCSTNKTTWVSADKISDISFVVNTTNDGRGQVRGDIDNEAYYGKWCKVIVASAF